MIKNEVYAYKIQIISITKAINFSKLIIKLTWGNLFPQDIKFYRKPSLVIKFLITSS